MTGWDLRALPTHPPGEHAHHLHAIDLDDAERIVRNLVHGEHFAVVACECETTPRSVVAAKLHDLDKEANT